MCCFGLFLRCLYFLCSYLIFLYYIFIFFHLESVHNAVFLANSLFYAGVFYILDFYTSLTSKLSLCLFCKPLKSFLFCHRLYFVLLLFYFLHYAFSVRLWYVTCLVCGLWIYLVSGPLFVSNFVVFLLICSLIVPGCVLFAYCVFKLQCFLCCLSSLVLDLLYNAQFCPLHFRLFLSVCSCICILLINSLLMDFNLLSFWLHPTLWRHLFIFYSYFCVIYSF